MPHAALCQQASHVHHTPRCASCYQRRATCVCVGYNRDSWRWATPCDCSHDVTMAYDISYLHLVWVPCSIQRCPRVWHICDKVHGLAGWLQLNCCQRMGVPIGLVMVPARCLSRSRFPYPIRSLWVCTIREQREQLSISSLVVLEV